MRIWLSALMMTVLMMTGLMTGFAWADCEVNGVLVPEGTRIGGLICENGEWVPG